MDEVRDEMAATRGELRDICQGVHPAILVEASMTVDSPAEAGTVLTVLLPVTADDH